MAAKTNKTTAKAKPAVKSTPKTVGISATKSAGKTSTRRK